MLRPSVVRLPDHSSRTDASRQPSSSAPGRPTSSTRSADIAGCGPKREVGIMLEPALKPCSGASPGVVPISRLSQPTRAREPGSASSTSSMASKCDRLATGSPAACTVAICPAVHSGTRDAMAGCRPNMPSLTSSRSEGMPMLGRAR